MKRNRPPLILPEKELKKRQLVMSEQLYKIAIFFAIGMSILLHIFWHINFAKPPSANDTKRSVSNYISNHKFGDVLTIYFTDTGKYIPCNLDIIKHQDFSADFLKANYDLRRSLIIRFNQSDDWLKNPQKFSFDYMKQKFKSYNVKVGDGVEILRKGGMPSDTVSFTQFLDNILKINATDTRYLHSKAFFSDPSYSSEINFASFFDLNISEFDKYFFLGGKDSGVAFHKHSDSWHGLIQGKKRWFIYPPSEAGSVWYGYKPSHWDENILPTLNTSTHPEPFQCVQEPGDILYIPEGFYHATNYLEPAMSVGLQRKTPRTKHEEYVNALKYATVTTFDKILSKALKLMPNNTEFLYLKALHLINFQKQSEAGEILEVLIQKHPMFLSAILNLAEIKSKYEMKLLEGQLLYKRALELDPNFWEIYESYGDFLLNYFGERKEAIQILEQGTKIKDNQILFWQFLKTAYDLQNNRTASALAAEKISELSKILDVNVDF